MSIVTTRFMLCLGGFLALAIPANAQLKGAPQYATASQAAASSLHKSFVTHAIQVAQSDDDDDKPSADDRLDQVLIGTEIKLTKGVLKAANRPKPVSSASSHPLRQSTGRTKHGEQRHQEALNGDSTREVGDINRVIREGRRFKDVQSGNDVYVKGDRAVVVAPKSGKIVTQMKATRTTTQSKLQSGKWQLY